MTTDVMRSSANNRSQWLVIALTVIALLVGWGVRTSTEGATRAVSEGGIQAELPASWTVETPGAGTIGESPADPNLVMIGSDPLDPGTRYSVSLYPEGSAADLSAVAAIRNLQRAQYLTAYRVLEQTPVTVDGRDGYRVSFAYVDASEADKTPVVFEGVDYYFPDGEHAIVATLETRNGLEDALTAFQEFAAALHMGDAQ